MTLEGSKILVATDLSEHGARAAHWAHRLAGRLDLDVEVLHVIEIGFRSWLKGLHDLMEDPERRARSEERLERWFEEVIGERPAAAHIDVGYPYRRIKEIAQERDAAILVVGMSGKGALKRLAVGSTAFELALDPPCPLALVHPDHDDPASGDLAVGVDFSPAIDPAISLAVDLGHLLGSRLHLVHSSTNPSSPVFDLEEIPEELRGDSVEAMARAEMQQVVERHEFELGDIEYLIHIRESSAARGLVEFAREKGIGTFVLGHHHHIGGEAAIFTSVALKVLQKMENTILIAPHDYGADEEGA
jgi:nucleotide-binding universal stress UspA family protein